MPDIQPTTRAYTLKLSGDGNWRELLWKTHLIVNRGTLVWGDWLLILRGGLPAALADEHPERRVMLALSWLSVESPVTLLPSANIVASGNDSPSDRCEAVLSRFRSILDRLGIIDCDNWFSACAPALTARIRNDACWVDRSACFFDLKRQFPGLTPEWAAATLFDFLGGQESFFAMPDKDSTKAAEAKDFVQKAGGWLSRNWGAGEKSDSGDIGERLKRLADSATTNVIGHSGLQVLSSLLQGAGGEGTSDSDPHRVFKQLKQAVGWKGRPSKGALALEKLAGIDQVTGDQWEQTRKKLLEEAAEQTAKSTASSEKPAWMSHWRDQMELRLGMPYRTDKDLIWESGVMLDHALRRISAAHSWIKRAEVERQQFIEDAQQIVAVPVAAKEWLDSFCEERSSNTGAIDEYLIRKRALDSWDKVVHAWSGLGNDATSKQRINAARLVETSLDDNEKFGDIQLFEALAADDARCVWHDAVGKPDGGILKNYSAAKVAEHNQRRFKVPAYRHPDPLRHPVFVDFGNSRWGITYSALKTSHERESLKQKLAIAKTDIARLKIRQQLSEPPDLHSVTLNLWTGQMVEAFPLRWHGKRLWKDLDLQHFGEAATTNATRADRFGRVIAGQSTSAINITDVFGQKDWNGRLQLPRDELNHLADLIYGKHADPDFARLESLATDAALGHAQRRWAHLNWFLTTSAKLTPQGPWLDYVARGLPDDIEYKSGRSGPFLYYAANKERKGRARLNLARLPGLRVLSLDLGHRYAAACAVWETLSKDQMEEVCRGRHQSPPLSDTLYIHLRRESEKVHASGHRKGQPIVETTIYRRIGPDTLPDGEKHPAPWARLDRQFLIKLPGEEKPARFASASEFADFNKLRTFVGMALDFAPPLDKLPGQVNRRIDQLQADSTRIAQLGLRRLGSIARVAHILTAKSKPISGGRTTASLTREERVDYVLDALVIWQELAQSCDYKDDWARQMWDKWINGTFNGPQPVEVSVEVSRSERKARIEASRDPLRHVAEQLIDADNTHNQQLNRFWSAEWKYRSDQWRMQLRRLRRLILPHIGPRPRVEDTAAFAQWKQSAKDIRRSGGLTLRRLKTIRDLYQVLKAFRMRPEPDDLRKNVPAAGDESSAKFGRRILDQLERLREQRIKQLSSRIIEAALGVGSENRSKHWDSRKRPVDRIADTRFDPCHAVVVENLENYRPEETRLRRENRQLMTWAARNVRKYIIEGCQLYGLHFVEVSPSYTSRQDSRTGAPGIRCEDIFRSHLASAGDTNEVDPAIGDDHRYALARWNREAVRIRDLPEADRSNRDRVVLAALEHLDDPRANKTAIRLPRRGGEIFVSANCNSPAASGLQADLNAAANIGLKAILDPDWLGSWWFILVDIATGQPDVEKTKGCPLWLQTATPLMPIDSAIKKPRSRGVKSDRTSAYAWNPLHWHPSDNDSKSSWQATGEYWRIVELEIANQLILRMKVIETPW